MSKIFVVVNGKAPWGDLEGMALAEDGTQVAVHISSSVGWARHDLGLVGERQHEKYNAHYPNGWELVDLLDLSHDEAAAHPEFAAALLLANSVSVPPQSEARV